MQSSKRKGLMTSITIEEVKERFVTNQTRKEIFSGYVSYMSVLFSKITTCKQYIDGSFTTIKKEPNDIDICTLLDIDFMGINRDFLEPLKSKNARINYKVDGYFCPICKEDSPYAPLCKERYEYWTNWLSHDREGKPKELFVSDITKEDVC